MACSGHDDFCSWLSALGPRVQLRQPVPLTEAEMSEDSRTVFNEWGEKGLKKDLKKKKKQLDNPESKRAGPKSEHWERRETDGDSLLHNQLPGRADSASSFERLILLPHRSELENCRFCCRTPCHPSSISAVVN